jgi:serine/threonine-protein kinase
MTVAITDPVVLAQDVLLVSVTELPHEIREKLDVQDEDFALTRRHGRVPSKIVAAAGAALLSEFRTERTIIDGILAYSRGSGLDARDVLASAYQMLRECIDARFLVSVDSSDSRDVTPTLARGDVVGSFEIRRPVHVMEDVEVYQGRSRGKGPAAIKIVRHAGTPRGDSLLEREASVLERMMGDCTAKLLEVGDVDGRHYVASEWRSGVSPRAVAAELRNANTTEATRALLALCSRLLAAYAKLHGAGVIHGDVHPRNILVDRHGAPTLLDFGLSRGMEVEGATSKASRGGVAYYFEPEYAVARLDGDARPPVSEAGEQYAVAALLYVLLTGERYLDFSVEEQQMLRQIAYERPLPFASRGRTAWPQVEDVLGIALSKNPADRFPSMQAFLDAWDEIGPPKVPQRTGPKRTEPSDVLLDEWLERISAPGSMDSGVADRAEPFSVWYGAAGVGYALYRIACIRGDSRLLFHADHWLAKAERSLRDGGARQEGAEGPSDAIGDISPFHNASGVHAVRALIARAMGDLRACEGAILEFVNASDGECTTLDLTLGRSGTLLVSSLLLEALPRADSRAGRRLRDLGDATLAEIWPGTRKSPRPHAALRNLGMAHGRAGILYATMRWCESARVPVPPEVEPGLDELSEWAEHKGRGIRWPWLAEDGTDHAGRYMSGWCNGSAGFVFLWTQAHRSFGRSEFTILAEQTAWNAWEDSGTTTHLCCGLAGRAYALLDVYRQTGGLEWLQRATDMTHRAAELARGTVDGKEPRLSLYRGDVGVALLAADLTRPGGACLPMLGQEGWPRGSLVVD